MVRQRARIGPLQHHARYRDGQGDAAWPLHLASSPVWPDLVIFDCDGVLVDSERLTVDVEARVLTELGWPITSDEVVERFVGRSSASMLAEVARHLGAELTEQFDAISTIEIRTAFETRLEAVEGIAHLLDAIDAAGVPTCVASSGSHDKMRATLGITGLWHRFDGRIFSADEVAHGKPAPDLFVHAAAQMDVDPAGCAVVEDSPFGVQAAIAAGMTAYGFTGGLAADGALAAAGAIPFARMIDLVDLLAAPRPPRVER